MTLTESAPAPTLPARLSPKQAALGTVAAGALSAAATALTTAVAGTTAAGALLGLLLAVGGLWAAVIDARSRRLPDRLLFPLYGLANGGLIILAIALGDPVRIAIAAAGGLALWTVYFCIGLAGGVGYGDVKLAGIIGLFLTWQDWRLPLLATALAFVIAAPHALASVIRGARSKQIAFGPYMVAGAVFAGVAPVFF